MYYWVVFRKGDTVTTSPYFTSQQQAEIWAMHNDVPENRIITQTRTRRHPTKMSDIIKGKVLEE